MIILQANKFFHERGGSERYMFALSRELEARGHEVLHFSMAHPDNRPSPQRRYFVPQRDYAGPAWRAASLRSAVEFVRSPEAARCLDRLLDERRPDIAHLHNIYHQLTPSIIERLAARRVPVVMTLHDYKLVCPSYTMFAHGAPCYRCRGGRFHRAVAIGCGGSRARAALLAVEAYWQRWTRVYDRVDCFIAPSEYLRDIMLDAGIGRGRIEYVAQLSPDPDGNETVSAGEERLLAGLPPRFIVYIGRLSPEKGVHVLLHAMQECREVPLVVAGDGPQEDELRRLCSSSGLTHVTLAGRLGRGAIERLLGRCAALVVPSVWAENAPMVAFEAARAATPVIASRAGGMTELLDRMDGLPVPPADAGALAQAIHRIWHADAAGLREQVRSAWARHGGAHTAPAHLDAIESVYRRTVATSRAAA